MTASNSNVKEDMENVLSCSSQCVECESISDPKKIDDSITVLNEKLDGLQGMINSVFYHGLWILSSWGENSVDQQVATTSCLHFSVICRPHLTSSWHLWPLFCEGRKIQIGVDSHRP